MRRSPFPCHSTLPHATARFAATSFIITPNATLTSPSMSQSLARADTTARSPLHPSRISLIDNTVPKPPPSTDSQPDDNEPQSCRPKDGHIESIRRAIAEHRYKRWSLAPGLTNIESDGAIEVPDERAMGMLSSRDSGCEGTSANGSGSPAMGDAADDTYRQGRVEDGAVRSVGKEAGDTGQKRAGRAKEIEIGEIDVLYENQRGYACNPVPIHPV